MSLAFLWRDSAQRRCEGRRFVKLSAFFAVTYALCASNVADAAPRAHDGFYFEGAVGAAFVSASTSEPAYAQGIAAVDEKLFIDEKLSGIGPSTSVLLGGTPVRGLVVGVGYTHSQAISPTFQSERGSRGSVGVKPLYMWSVGPFVDFFPLPRSGLHLQALAGLGAVSIDMDDVATDSNSYCLGAGVGYEFWVGNDWSVGALGRVNYGAFASGSIWAPALLATFTYH